MKRYIYGIGPCYCLTSGAIYIRKHKWIGIIDEDGVKRISKQSKVNNYEN